MKLKSLKIASLWMGGWSPQALESVKKKNFFSLFSLLIDKAANILKLGHVYRFIFENFK